MKTQAIEAPRESPESFAALAAAVHPHWHIAILGLACKAEHLSEKLDLLTDPTMRRDGIIPAVRQLVDDLIGWLDDWGDLDPDLEPDEGAEPSLGFLEAFPGQGRGTIFAGDDREKDDADDEDGGDDEPSLGSLEHHCCSDGWWPGPNPTGDQTLWGHGPRNDLEDEHDGREVEGFRYGY